MEPLSMQTEAANGLGHVCAFELFELPSPLSGTIAENLFGKHDHDSASVLQAASDVSIATLFESLAIRIPSA